MDKNELIEYAKEAMEFSYSPYSKFKVGACVLTKDGEIFLGANIENSSYGLSMCAERNAIYNAYCHGKTYEDIAAIAIVADSLRPVSPCGACRQVLSELIPAETPIYLGNLKGEIKETNLNELIPYVFGMDDLDL